MLGKGTGDRQPYAQPLEDCNQLSNWRRGCPPSAATPPIRFPAQPLAPHLCPVLQPLVELKYPVVSLIAIWRVPPAREQRMCGQSREQPRRGAQGWGMGRDVGMRTYSPRRPAVCHPRPPQALTQTSLGQAPCSFLASPSHLPNARLQVCRWVHGSRSVGEKQHSWVSDARDPHPWAPQPPSPLPCCQQQAVRVLVSGSPTG